MPWDIRQFTWTHPDSSIYSVTPPGTPPSNYHTVVDEGMDRPPAEKQSDSLATNANPIYWLRFAVNPNGIPPAMKEVTVIALGFHHFGMTFLYKAGVRVRLYLGDSGSPIRDYSFNANTGGRFVDSSVQLFVGTMTPEEYASLQIRFDWLKGDSLPLYIPYDPPPG